MLSYFIKDQKTRGKFALYWAKFWMTLAAISIAINLFIVLTLVQMAPKLKVIAQILPSPMNTLDHIQIDTLPANRLMDSKSHSNRANRELLDEMLIRYYIDRRVSYFADKNEMTSRWGARGEIRRLSSPAVYAKFSKNIQEKIKQTNLERYGVENPNHRKEIRDKIKQTVLERYGVEYFCQHEKCYMAGGHRVSKINKDFYENE